MSKPKSKRRGDLKKGDLFRDTIRKMKSIESGHLDAQWILMDVLNCDRSALLLKADQPVSEAEAEKVDEYVQRRILGEPLAYILGHQDFYSHRFVVTPDVLIPRPETELIIDEVLKLQRPIESIADLGCGSGCIGLSLLLEMPQARLWTCDISEAAIEVMKQNAVALGVLDRVKYSISDVTENLMENKYDVIVSNPPYIAKNDERVEDSVKLYEPHSALFAKNKGLEFYEKWLPWSFKALRKNGVIVFEFGEGQAESVSKLAEKAGLRVMKIEKDLAGIDRLIVAVKGS